MQAPSGFVLLNEKTSAWSPPLMNSFVSTPLACHPLVPQSGGIGTPLLAQVWR